MKIKLPVVRMHYRNDCITFTPGGVWPATGDLQTICGAQWIKNNKPPQSAPHVTLRSKLLAQTCNITLMSHIKKVKQTKHRKNSSNRRQKNQNAISSKT